jgi:hypothetical protein
MKIALAAITLVLLTTAAQADGPSYPATLGLAKVCGWTGNAAVSQLDTARCNQRVLGTIDGVVAGERRMHGHEICLPARSTPPEKIAVIRKYIGDHPEAGSADVGDVVAAALTHAYPCH